MEIGRKGPFGLWMGMTVDEAGIDQPEIAPAKYQTTKVPVPHSAFESYSLQITPKFGLSWVKAIGKDIPTSAYGFELKTGFDALEQRLSTVYGRGNRTDLLIRDSIWNESRDWMMGLLNHERYLLTEWSAEYGSSLKDSLVSIGLIATALDQSTGFLSVEYTFENSEAADAEIAAAEDTAL
jgi:hypothetical protein